MTIFTANPYAQYLRFKDEIDIAITRVLESQKYILSDEVSALEKEFASYFGAKVDIKVASKGNGKLIIPFSSEEDFKRLKKLISGAE